MHDYALRAAVTEGDERPDWSPSAFAFSDCDAFVYLNNADPPFQFDLGEAAAIESDGGELRLDLIEGRTLHLSGMGRMEEEIRSRFLRATRDRIAKVFRFGTPLDKDWQEGEAAAVDRPQAAAWRLYPALLGIIPLRGIPTGIPYADIRQASFDESAYQIVLDLHSGPPCRLSKLGKGTAPFLEALRKAVLEHSTRYQAYLKDLIPDIPGSMLRRISTQWREGVALPAETLDGTAPGLVNRILQHLTDEGRRLFLDVLRRRAEASAIGCYFSADADAAGSGAPGGVPFGLFPLKGGQAIAWETLSSDALATYVFRGGSAIVGELNAALREIRFAREPIYIPEDELKTKGEFRHHVVLLRRSGALQSLRERFLGRAIHTDPETYEGQLTRLAAC